VTGPPPATAAVRVAVRRGLAGVDGPVAAAVSGGADSLAVAAGLAFERPGSLALVVDHGLQQGSAEMAQRAASLCREIGLETHVLTAVVGDEGGPEAAARTARYAVLDAAVQQHGLAAVLLGHTLDDQAETVLLGLARGAGARALGGMAPVRGAYRRPLLGLRRQTTHQACAEQRLVPWEDPQNADPSFARARARHRVLPIMQTHLGPGIAEALARTAAQLREDADALDALTPETNRVADLERLAPALRSRALKQWAQRACGQPVTSAHVEALRALIEDWRGQGPVGLPGGVQALRKRGRLVSDPARRPSRARD
jgi:tRNA(Ile)-lysidine synthase